MPISRKSRKSSKSMKKSLNNKKVNCKDLIKTPHIKMTKQLLCLQYHNKLKTKCNNDFTKLMLKECKDKNSNTNSKKKELNCKDELNSSFSKGMKDISCNVKSKKNKRQCETSYENSFLNACNEKKKSMKSINSIKGMKV